MMHRIYLAVFALAPVFSGAAELPPEQPEAIIEWVSSRWTQEGWQLPESKHYMRNLEDTGWQARILAMQKLVQLGEPSVKPLLSALKTGSTGTRIFAAQTLGYLPRVPAEPLFAAAKSDANAAVRLYTIDSLGMTGAKNLKELLEPLKATEKNKDAQKHIAYAIEREGTTVDAAIIKRLKEWKPATIHSATVGKPAPDFEMPTFNGDTVRLSDYKGKKSVVLIFIYGDT